ncbi:MAG: radical SAM family heme chaperone HemW [Desulfovibrio sp.]|nr:radical SAM family heme chaperone HemW [Desulfovibrio sp.]
MLLYIHVPFCRSRCRYCAFHSEALGRSVDPYASVAVRDYVDTLLLELATFGDRLGGAHIQTVFFGGGTPSLLPPRIVGILLERVRRYFTLDDGAEITLEANPESLKGSLVPSQLLEAGVNRLSIGLQSLDPDMLHILGRSHKAQDSLHAVYTAREAGFANIGVDLMWGLPGQSVRHWLQTLKDVVRLAPEHISAYGLTLEPGTPLEKASRTEDLRLPPERDQNIMFLEGAAFLERHGYIQYEISNFARMGYQCRHNTGYWSGVDYLGLGPSATSTIAGKRWTNPSNRKAWEEKVKSGTDRSDEEEVITPLIRVLETIMLSLRTSRGLSFARYKAMTGHEFLTDHRRMVQAMHENGLVRIRNGYMRLTPNGMVVSNSILSNLFEQTKKILTDPLPELDPSATRDLATDVQEKGPVRKNTGAVRAFVFPKA